MRRAWGVRRAPTRGATRAHSLVFATWRAPTRQPARRRRLQTLLGMDAHGNSGILAALASFRPYHAKCVAVDERVGRLYMTTSSEPAISAWQLESGAAVPLAHWDGLCGTAAGLVAGPSAGDVIAACFHERRVLLLRRDRREASELIAEGALQPYGLGLAPDGARLAVSSPQGVFVVAIDACGAGGAPELLVGPAADEGGGCSSVCWAADGCALYVADSWCVRRVHVASGAVSALVPSSEAARPLFCGLLRVRHGGVAGLAFTSGQRGEVLFLALEDEGEGVELVQPSGEERRAPVVLCGRAVHGASFPISLALLDVPAGAGGAACKALIVLDNEIRHVPVLVGGVDLERW